MEKIDHVFTTNSWEDLHRPACLRRLDPQYLTIARSYLAWTLCFTWFGASVSRRSGQKRRGFWISWQRHATRFHHPEIHSKCWIASFGPLPRNCNDGASDGLGTSTFKSSSRMRSSSGLMGQRTVAFLWTTSMGYEKC